MPVIHRSLATALGCALLGWCGCAAAGDLNDALRARFPSVPRASIDAVVSRAWLEALGSEGVPSFEFECARDYGIPCPEEWVDGGDGATCLAPVGYRGACPRQVRFGSGGATPEAKRKQASACGAKFPCKGACTADYNEACPSEWRVEGLDCVAPGSYVGPCVARKRLHDFSWSEKKQWADACQVRWPCRLPQGGAANAEAAS